MIKKYPKNSKIKKYKCKIIWILKQLMVIYTSKQIQILTSIDYPNQKIVTCLQSVV